MGRARQTLPPLNPESMKASFEIRGGDIVRVSTGASAVFRGPKNQLLIRVFAGAAKVHLGANEEAVEWLRRSIEANRNLPMAHLFPAAALGNLGKLEEARAENAND